MKTVRGIHKLRLELNMWRNLGSGRVQARRFASRSTRILPPPRWRGRGSVKRAAVRKAVVGMEVVVEVAAVLAAARAVATAEEAAGLKAVAMAAVRAAAMAAVARMAEAASPMLPAALTQRWIVHCSA